MGDNIGLIQLDEARALIQPLETDDCSEKIGLRPATPPVRKLTDLSR